MAYTQANFVRDLALFSAGGILGPTRTRQLLAYAARKGIQLAGMGARAVLPSALPVIPAAVQSATPYAIGAGLGVAALGTPEGQALLAAAEEHGRQSRILFERAQQHVTATPERIQAIIGSSPVSPEQAMRSAMPIIRKRVASKFNKAVSKGMKTIKSSTSYGKRGVIKPAKKAFALVTKLASAKKRKKKAPKSGIRRRIWNAMKGL